MKQGDVIAVLKEAGKPLSAKEILELLRARGMEAPGGNTPEQTVSARIYESIKHKGAASPFSKAGKGIFTVNPNYHAPQAGEKKHVAKPGKTAASPAPVVGKTADSILDKQGNRKIRGKGKAGKSAKAHQKGYVYILTNPSFREDWVKIGKSARPVDVRSKELDNTAVPLPFEIFATMETTKYNEVEKLVHKTIDRLTDLRIRQNREFFNVPPKTALEIFTEIADTIEDAVVLRYADNKPIKQAERKAGKKATPAPRAERRRGPFKFSMIGVKAGEMVTFVPTGIQVKVASDSTVEYKGHIYKLSPFVRKYLPKRQRNASGAYPGPKFFTYKGKLLDDLRSAREGRN